MKLIKRIAILLIISLFFNITVLAEEKENDYKVLDYSDESLEVLFSSNDYNDAYYFYVNNVYNYQNLCLFENDEAILMEYGTMYIQSDEDIVTYYSIIDETEKALSNYNEYELLYIDETIDQVRFVIGGDIGLIYRDEVKYYPYKSHSISFYNKENNSLVHHIASSVNNYYKYNLQIDTYPDFLDSNIKYYSFDSHYFYDDFYKMSDDYYSYVNDEAVNVDNPYYNYYAYLPSRSYTNYSFNDFNSFINNILGFKGRLESFVDFDKDGANDVVNRSEYYGNMNAFTSAEKIYGVNALTSLAWSCEESSFGKSMNSYLKSNVYNHEALIGKEIENNKYNSVKSSIYSHIENYVSKKYCDLFSSLYVGSHIGDHMAGIASIYSYDPYFADKVVSKAYFSDLSLGLKDKDTYPLAITSRSVTLYYDKELTNTFYTARQIRDYSLVILDEYDECYKVQCDYSMNQTGEYNPESCVAYVKKNRIDRTIDGKNNNIQYYKYNIETNDGIKTLYSKSEYDVIKEFVYKDSEGEVIKSYILQDEIYVPQSKKIKEIFASNLVYPSININGSVINNGKLHITYDDGTNEVNNITGDYLLSSSNKDTTTTINLSYNGIKTSINISGNYRISNDLSLDSFNTYNKFAYSNYAFDDVIKFDNTFDISNVNDITTYVRENEYDLNVAGAYPSFIYHSSDRLSNIINTYYFDIKQVNENSSISSVVSPYGFEFVDGFDISISRCFYKIDLVSPVIMQVKLDHQTDNCVYSVYYKDKNGDIIKLPTQYSDNYIKFMTNDDGKYYVYKASSPNIYSINDDRLIINMDNNGADYYEVAQEGIILFSISIGGYLLYALYTILIRKDKKSWIGFKKLLQQAESVQEEKQNN